MKTFILAGIPSAEQGYDNLSYRMTPALKNFYRTFCVDKTRVLAIERVDMFLRRVDRVNV